ncbi:Fic/DOC family protein [Pseudomonas cuatrocienegasensis]|uniref:Fic/DOC family protein n=1 Tax=Pseudomonas cuatrocienegasensis TaxID=543360 RepID=A0ABY1BI27_9PSED|nr:MULTISPECIES: Fic family protein [Pseudomonas]OEC34541.1 cell filamentation protein Fic [Pseudomonas sp. 21C1]SEQ91080.1 Fic/DOC family protein [Pseudomonas cuatrocienegasensis]
MANSRLDNQLNAIEALIAERRDGIGIAELERCLAQRLSLTLNRRTLQRRLENLLAQQRILSSGESVALVYQPPQLGSGAAPSAVAIGDYADLELYVPVSAEGAAIRDQVRRPLMHRRPVGYQHAFLERYEPGVSFYLPESLRAQLHEIGRTAQAARPAGTYARDIYNRLLVDLSWASSRLEGNTYSRLDTQNLIELGQVAQGKDAQETQMILNHKAAIEMLIEDVEQVDFNPFTFQNLHAILAENLMADEEACGRLRRRPVEISATVFQPLALPQVLEDCFIELLHKATAIADPFEQAFFLMVQLPYLQPFEDVNKRVSRIGANIPLIRHNLCPLSFIDVPERAYVEGILGVYELNRIELLRDIFVWAYERSCQRYLAISQSMSDPDPLRIRYRTALIEAVQWVVKQRLAPSAEVIRQLAQDKAAAEDRDAFAQLLSNALKHLHEGSVARYRLRHSEFLVWQPIRDRVEVGGGGQ